MKVRRIDSMCWQDEHIISLWRTENTFICTRDLTFCTGSGPLLLEPSPVQDTALLLLSELQSKSKFERHGSQSLTGRLKLKKMTWVLSSGLTLLRLLYIRKLLYLTLKTLSIVHKEKGNRNAKNNQPCPAQPRSSAVPVEESTFARFLTENANCAVLKSWKLSSTKRCMKCRKL